MCALSLTFFQLIYPLSCIDKSSIKISNHTVAWTSFTASSWNIFCTKNTVWAFLLFQNSFQLLWFSSESFLGSSTCIFKWQGQVSFSFRTQIKFFLQIGNCKILSVNALGELLDLIFFDVELDFNSLEQVFFLFQITHVLGLPQL